MAKKQPKALPAPKPKAPEPDAPGTVMGRPTSYQPEFTRITLALCQRGATDAELAEFFEVTTRTINRWKVTHPDFLDAIRRGKEVADDRVEDSLYHRAMGTEYEKAHPVKVKTITYDDNGKKLMEQEKVEIVMVKEVIPADTTAAIFWLKNRRAKEWRDIRQHEVGKPGDFSDWTDEELEAFIKAETPQVQSQRKH